MIPELYLLRPSDWSSVPAVFGVLGITSPLPAVPLAGCSVHRLARSSVPMPPPSPRGTPTAVSAYHPHRTNGNKRRPSLRFALSTRTRRSTRPQEGRSSSERDSPSGGAE